MNEPKRKCLLTRLRSLMENAMVCGDSVEADIRQIANIVKAMEHGTALTDTQIERAIVMLEETQVDQHRRDLRGPIKDPELQ